MDSYPLEKVLYVPLKQQVVTVLTGQTLSLQELYVPLKQQVVTARTSSHN
ncbi:MAG: hypothetical protein N4A72_17770 [Bacteroidales bacterium]|nr:hypothetical protein [Bacteroidales bacterium]